MLIESKMKDLNKEQYRKATELKESLVLDQQLQGYIDVCDKILAKEKEEKKQATEASSMGGVGSGAAVFTPNATIPMVPQTQKTPTVAVQKVQSQQPGVVNPNIMNTLQQMKQKAQSGQDVTEDLKALFQTLS